MADPRATAGRGLAVAVLGGVAAGGAALAAANRPWARAEVLAEGVPRAVVETTGVATVPWVGALALVTITASLALLPTGGRLRRGIAGLVALASAGMAVGALLAGPDLTRTLTDDLLANPSAAGLDAAGIADAADRTVWRWLTFAAGIGGVLLGAWALLRAPAWPVMGSRYEAPAATTVAASAGEAGRGSDASSETDLWRALDRGEDPT